MCPNDFFYKCGKIWGHKFLFSQDFEKKRFLTAAIVSGSYTGILETIPKYLGCSGNALKYFCDQVSPV